MCSLNYPSAIPRTYHLHHCLPKQQYFSPSYVDFFLGFLYLGQSFTEKTGKAEEPSLSFPLPTFILFFSFSFLSFFLSSCSCLPLLLSLSLSCIFLHNLTQYTHLVLHLLVIVPFRYSCWFGLLFSYLMKKMKGPISVDHPAYAVYGDQRARSRLHGLLLDYQDLQEETNVMRMKLQAAKQKKFILSAEVRFLRQRYRYLMQNPSPKQDISHQQKLKVQATLITKGKKYNRMEYTLRPPKALHLKSKERISIGIETAVQKIVHMFDLNQNASSNGRKDPSFLNSAPLSDLNHKDKIQIGKETSKKSITRFFDLNQISREEEELLGNIEPLRVQETKRITPRGVSEEQHNDIKLPVCRNVGSGSNMTVKRKISWQDQVALRV